MKKSFLILLIALLVGINIFFLYQYTQVLTARHNLETDLTASRQETNALKDKANNLQAEVESEKQRRQTIEAELNATEEKLRELNIKLSEAPEEIGRLNTEIASLGENNLALQKEKEELVSRLNILYQEKQALEAKLGSLVELKKAVRDLKAKMFAAKVKKEKPGDACQLAEGNRGYLIKDGKSTWRSKVRIEVLPAP